MIYYSRRQARTEIESCAAVAEIEQHTNPRRWAQLLQDKKKWEAYLHSLEAKDLDADRHGNLVDGWGRIVEKAS